MENNLPIIIAKRLWSMVRVVLFMLRKGISKGKLTMDLNMILKRRGKLAGKAITNLMFHHHHGGCSTTSYHDSTLQFSAQREYEFKCSNTSNYFFPKRHDHNRNHNHLFISAHVPPSFEDEAVTINKVKVVLDMLNSKTSEVMMDSSYSSLTLPITIGFEKSPMVRQVTVVNSSLLPREVDNMVDKKAEDFIKRFYKELRKQD